MLWKQEEIADLGRSMPRGDRGLWSEQKNAKTGDQWGKCHNQPHKQNLGCI
jgi:hypothetical protein